MEGKSPKIRENAMIKSTDEYCKSEF